MKLKKWGYTYLDENDVVVGRRGGVWRKRKYVPRPKRFIRIPHYYLTYGQCRDMHNYLDFVLNVIWCIHNDKPHRLHKNEFVRHFQYYPSFLLWVHDKAHAQILKNDDGKNRPWCTMKDGVRDLKSRGIGNFLPPTNAEIAQDVVFLLHVWGKRKSPLIGGVKLPLSYYELAQRIYGYTANERALERVELHTGAHFDVDSDWYRF